MAKLSYLPQVTQLVSERVTICRWTALLWGQILHTTGRLKPFLVGVSPQVLSALHCFLALPRSHFHLNVSALDKEELHFLGYGI